MNNKIYWMGCYSGGRGDELFTPKSNAHPAKMSGALLDRIRRFGEERGWWKPGDCILDNYWGIGTTGLMRLHGYDVIGVELEQHFIEMAQENARILDGKGAWVPKLGECRIIQGDSRKLTELLGIQADGGLTSPPYINFRKGGGLNIEPPESFRGVLRTHTLKEGDAEGQIGNLPDKPDAALTSPPFTGTPDWHRETLHPRNQQAFFCKGYADASVTSPPYAGQNQRDIAEEEYGSQLEGGLKRNIRQTQPYGESEGQIAALPDQPDGAVLSPPWGDQKSYQIYDEEKGFHSYDENEPKNRMKRDYVPGSEEGQIGNLPDAAVLSPPYAGSTGHSRGSAGPPRRKDGSLVDDALHRSDGYGKTEGQIEKLPDRPDGAVLSPPYTERHSYPDAEREIESVRKLKADPHSQIGGEHIHIHEGDSEGQIGNLPDRPDAAVLSPPYGDAISGGRISGIDWDKADRPDRLQLSSERHNVQGCHEWEYGEDEGQIGNLPDKPDGAVLSPPYVGLNETSTCDTDEPADPNADWKGDQRKGRQGTRWQYTKQVPKKMGKAKGQIANLPDKPDAAVLSPPYGGQRMDGGEVRPGYSGMRPYSGDEGPEDYRPRPKGEGAQIGDLPDQPDAAVTSPPYGETLSCETHGIDWEKASDRWGRVTTPGRLTSREEMAEGRHYGEEEGQIGGLPEDSGEKETYQQAMAKCYHQLFLCLKPGGVACVVTKNPTREGKIRRLDLDTAQLLLFAGFELWCPICECWTEQLHLHPDDQLEPVVGYRAVLAKEKEQKSLFEEIQDHVPDWTNVILATEPWPGLGWKHVITPDLKHLEGLKKTFGTKFSYLEDLLPETAYWLRFIPRGESALDEMMLKGRVSFFKRLHYRKGLPIALWEVKKGGVD